MIHSGVVAKTGSEGAEIIAGHYLAQFLITRRNPPENKGEFAISSKEMYLSVIEVPGQK